MITDGVTVTTMRNGLPILCSCHDKGSARGLFNLPRKYPRCVNYPLDIYIHILYSVLIVNLTLSKRGTQIHPTPRVVARRL